MRRSALKLGYRALTGRDPRQKAISSLCRRVGRVDSMCTNSVSEPGRQDEERWRQCSERPPRRAFAPFMRHGDLWVGGG